jgi:hypothetical protein
VVVVDDGPTLTHGGMAYGAGFVAAVAAGAAEIVDPWPHAAPALARARAAWPNLGRVLPALGYGPDEREAPRATLDAVPADVIVAGTPIDLAALLSPRLPVVRARYEFAEAGEPGLGAESEGLLGYLLEQELANALPGRDVAALLTQVEVGADDPAFGAPAKPIGPVLDAAAAERLRGLGVALAPDRGGFRRVVASPTPRGVIELRTIALLLRLGVVAERLLRGEAGAVVAAGAR